MNIILLSTMHDGAESSGKPDIVNFYNKTKYGVDSLIKCVEI